MAQITSGIGLISGINTTDVINQLMALESRPKTQLQGQIDNANAQKQAYADLTTKLTSLQQIGMSLERPTTFTASTATSSDESVLTATAAASAAVGSYQFQVARMVSAQQSITNGFASANSLVGAGTLTLSLGGGDVKAPTTLAQLNGGAGVQRGSFRITDRAGNTSVIDISDAVTLDDVVKKINTALDTSVRASVVDDHLVLTDISGKTSSNLSVVDLSGGTAAANLGIASSVASNTLTGTRISAIGNSTSLASLNDGRGVRMSPSGGADFRATLADGSTIDVTLAGSQSVGDVIKAINTAGGTKLKATLNTSTNSISLTDLTTGSGSLAISSLNNSNAATDLGLTNASSGGVIAGSSILAGLDTVLLSSLNGGAGLPLGKITIQDRTGATKTVNLAGSTSLQDILDRINQSGAKVSATLNSAGTGIQLTDTSGGATGNIVIGDVNSTTAAALGIAGTFDTNTAAVNGANLHFKWVSENTLLSKYNGGKGVTPGSFTITNSSGTAATVDLSQGTFNTLGDVIQAINAKNMGVTASINANGNGLLLTDTAGGAGKLTVANVNGTTATDLNIAGTATGTTIDGSFEKTLTISSTDTLATVQNDIQSLGWGVVANIVNDGSGVNGYHLSLTATNSGQAGRVVIDGGTTSIQTRNLVDGQDAAVFMGSGDPANSLLITSSTNQLTGVIPGVTVTLNGASTSPVTLNVTRDPSSVTKQMQDFTEGFNAIVDSITTLTKWDSNTNTGGLLLGDATIQTVQTQMYQVFNSFVTGAGQYRTLADVGMSLGDGAKIQFDSDKFNAAFAANPDAVKNMFTQATTGLGALIDQSMTSLVDPVTGRITNENNTLDAKILQYQDQMTNLDSILADKKNRLEEQFANMESVLAGLQSQSNALSSLTSISAPSSSKSSGH